MSNKHGRKPKQGNGSKELFDTQATGMKVQTVRRTFKQFGTPVNGVTGSVLQAAIGADQIIGSGDFLDYANVYQEYRVLGIKCTFWPRYTMSSYLVGALPLPMHHGSSFGGVASTVALAFAGNQITEQPGHRAVQGQGARPLVLKTTASMNPTARLWTSVLLAIPAANNIGVVAQYNQAIAATYNGDPLFDFIVETSVEFRGTS